MKNILTFDIEEWYDANYKNIDLAGSDLQKSNLENEVREILDLCERYQAKATFFILGKAAQKNPDSVKMIQEKGHEIASHGYEHRLVYNLSPLEFKADLKKSLEILESITGEKVFGYRAPSWSIKKETAWIYPILAEMGLKYSASCFPVKTFLYGMPDAPRFPYLIKNILEIPVSTIRILGKNIPFSGGAYFRFLPEFLIKTGIRSINRQGKPAIIYLHPREIDKKAPRLNLPFKEKLIHYWGISQTKNKLKNILKDFNFTSINEIYF